MAACSCGYVFPRRGHALPPPGSTAVPPPSPLSLRPCHPIIATPLHHHQCRAPSVPPYPVTLAPCQIHPATMAPMRTRGRTRPLRATTSSSACHPLACHHCLMAIPRCHLTDVPSHRLAPPLAEPLWHRPSTIIVIPPTLHRCNPTAPPPVSHPIAAALPLHPRTLPDLPCQRSPMSPHSNCCVPPPLPQPAIPMRITTSASSPIVAINRGAPPQPLCPSPPSYLTKSTPSLQLPHAIAPCTPLL